MPRDNTGPERPRKPKKIKPTIVLPAPMPDATIIVQGVQYKLSQRTDMMLGNISFHHPTSIGQWEAGTGKMKVLDNCCFNYPMTITDPKQVLLLQVVGEYGRHTVVPMLTETEVLHNVPVPQNALEKLLPHATYIWSEDHSIFEDGEINFVILDVVREINNWLSGDYWSCYTDDTIWKPEMCEYNLTDFMSHFCILEGTIQEMKNIKPMCLELELEKLEEYLEREGITNQTLIEIHHKRVNWSVQDHNEKYERFKDYF